MEFVTSIAIPVAAIGSGLMAGVFLTFSSFVMRALGQVPTAAGMEVMKAINVTVINTSFMAGFLGTAALCGLLVIGALLGIIDGGPQLIAGCLLYLVGTFGVTIAFNVPRNDHLDGLETGTSEADAYWQTYQREWTWWNHCRTVCSLLAAGLLTSAIS
ncbi:MAG: DUF1772 domain-containing protein [Gemmatimonadetes bacterium]|jgi:uncharacterized membrane protein|nr:DUF1772 domain-containing protein [Gemmatimonadota bacterium]MBT7862773.1 DUF1772 domain-containing protein [Gemmatimonadota bacterium]